MKEYCISEKLFIDIWKLYGSPKEIKDKITINKFLFKLVELSNTHIVLDHYSQVNFDYISKIEIIGKYTAIHWFNNNDLRIKYINKKLNDSEALKWEMFGYGTYEYFLFNIEKIKFIKENNHIFVLIKSHLIPQKEILKIIKEKYELIRVEENTHELYTNYIFWEGPEEDIKKHFCLVGNLPYYACIIQPKENIASTGYSKDILLKSTLEEAIDRLERVKKKLEIINKYDYDELFAVGNTIRRILEYLLKYYCVIKEKEIGKLDIEQKYGYVKLGELRKIISNDIIINQKLINTANELSHDSGAIFTKEDIQKFHSDVKEIVNTILDGKILI